MNNYKLTQEDFIKLSREYVDDVLGDQKLRTRKEHYYIFAISNFIATKEYFLKKKIENGRTKIVFNRTENIDIMPMILEFYNYIKSKNKNFNGLSFRDAVNIIEFEPEIVYEEELLTEEEKENIKDMYVSLYFFHKIRNALSHPGNCEIKQLNNESIVSIRINDSNTIDIPIELFDFIAFYVNSHIEKKSVEDIFQNYLIYKASNDNKKYYKYESKDAVNKIISLVSKVQIKKLSMEKNYGKTLGGSNLQGYIYDILEEFKYNYREKANEILDKLEKSNISDEEKNNIINQLNIIFRANKRITSVKIDKCVKNIAKMLDLDRKSASLYSHSIIVFTNIAEPQNTNAQEVCARIKRIINEIISIEIDAPENLNNREKRDIIDQCKEKMSKLLEELPNLIRIDEHKYRNSIFHNNVKFEKGNLHFWNQKDNSNPKDIHTFEDDIKPEIYNIQLKTIESYNMNVGEITIVQLFNILIHYYGDEIDIINEMMSKLFIINQFDKKLLQWNISINNFIENLNKKSEELSNQLR